MPHLHQNVVVPHSVEQMFDLVVAIDQYPKFLPWCTQAHIFKLTDQELDGSLTVSYKGFSQSFRTHNTHEKPHRMVMNLIDGPFKHFSGQWRFKKAQNASNPNLESCQIDFDLDYQFKNFLLEMAAGKVFDQIAKSLVDCFVVEAKRRYGN